MRYFTSVIIIVSFFVSYQLKAQHEPYPVYDTKSVIIQEPYLTDPSETGITVVWKTDTPGHSKVMYAKAGSDTLDQIAEMHEHGLLPVGTLHTIRIKGLKPGTTYKYKVMTRRVIKLKPYWPEMGNWVESPVYSFTTFDREKPEISFSVITDIHENTQRIRSSIQMIDWEKTDFLVHDGDAFHYLNNEDQLFSNFLSPIAKGLNQNKPIIYVRGNHELRGPYARYLSDYFPYNEGRFYFARNHGPAHIVVLDTGEDKPDSTNVYAGLNRLKEYRNEEYDWFKKHIDTSTTFREAPFRIILMHDPRWGWMDGKNNEWTDLANQSNINLVISGHWHRFRRINPGEGNGNKYPILVLGQKEIAHVDVSKESITVEVRNLDNEIVEAFRIDRNGKLVTNIKE